MSWMMAAQAAAGVAKGLMDYEASMDRYKQEAENYGTHKGSVEFETGARLRNLPTQAKAIADSAELQSLSVEQQRANTVAQLTVNAAAAGIAGDSVDAVINDAHLTADTAARSVENEETAAMLQVAQDAKDTIMTGEKEKGTMQLGNQPSIWASILGGVLGSF